MRSCCLSASSILGTILQVSERKAIWVHIKCCRLNSNLVCVSLTQCTWRLSSSVSVFWKTSFVQKTGRYFREPLRHNRALRSKCQHVASILMISYLFTVYYTTLSVSHTIMRQMVGRLVNEKLKRI